MTSNAPPHVDLVAVAGLGRQGLPVLVSWVFLARRSRVVHADVEPLLGFAVRLRALDAEARVCAPPDKAFAEPLAEAGRMAVIHRRAGRPR